MKNRCLKSISLMMAISMVISLSGCSDKTVTASGPVDDTLAVSDTGSAANEMLDADVVSSKDTLKIALPKNVNDFSGSKLSMNTFNVLFQMFDCLTEMRADMTIEPALAESWEMLDDYSWRFKLRQGVKFHDGTDFTADDVVATIDYLVNLNPRYFYMGNWMTAWPPEAIKEDDYTVLIKTAEPNLKVPELLSRVNIMPDNYAEDDTFFVDGLVGTGPYKFVEWEAGTRITLEANPDYWRGAPKIKNLVFDIVTDSSARVSAYLAGEYDLIYDLPYDYADSLKSDEKYQVLEQDLVSLSFIYFNPLNTDSVIQNPLIREAMMYAIDSDGIVEAIMYGYGTTASGVASHMAIGAADNGGMPKRDIEKAKALMKEANYNNEQIDFFYPDGEFNSALEISELIVAQLTEAGFNVKFTEVEAGLWKSTYQGNSGWDIAPNNVPGTFTGESDYYWTHALKSKIGWKSEEADSLLDKAMDVKHPETREEYLKEMMTAVWDLHPYLWATECVGIYGADKNLSGIDIIPLNLIYFRDAYFK